jgi:pimeloyl-ACP methyl ester carboxylesterase
MGIGRHAMDVGQSSDGVPFLKGGAGDMRIVVLAGIDALFRPLDGGQRAIRRASAIARLLPSCRWTIVGYGEPREGADLDEIAAASAVAIREIVGQPDVVIGISFGGFVAQRIAANEPDLVSKLVLLSSGHCFSAAGRERIVRQKQQLAAGDMEGLVRENALLFRRLCFNLLAGFALWLRGRRQMEGLRAPAVLLAGYRSIFSDHISGNGVLVGRIRSPTLVIGGSADQFFGAGVFRETAEMIEGARLVLFPGETHMLPIECPRAVAEQIRNFCA